MDNYRIWLKTRFYKQFTKGLNYYMKNCPIISYQRQSYVKVGCMKEECAFWNGGCLITKALEKYIKEPKEEKEKSHLQYLL